MQRPLVGLISLVLLLLLTALPSAAQAPAQPGAETMTDKDTDMCPMCQMRSMGMMGKQGMMMGHLGMFSIAHALLKQADELKLTDEQLGRLMRIAKAHAETRRSKMKAMRKEMMRIHAQVMAPAVSETDLRARITAHQKGMNALIDDMLAERKEAFAVLTDAQRKAMKPKTMRMPESDAADDSDPHDH